MRLGVTRCPPCSQNAHDKAVLVPCAQGEDYLTTPWEKVKTDSTRLSQFPIPWPASTMSNSHDLNAIVCETID